MAGEKHYVQVKIKDGWPSFGTFYREQLKQFLAAHEGKRAWMTIVVGNPRSLAQNRFLHGPLIDAFVRATGDTDRDKWKGRLKEMFLRVPDGKGGTYTQGTSELTVGEFQDFLEKCKEVLYDQHGGYLTELEHEMYEATKGKRAVHVKKDGTPVLFDESTGEVVEENIPW